MNVNVPTTATKFIVGQRVHVPALNMDLNIGAIEWVLRLEEGGTVKLDEAQYVLNSGTAVFRLFESQLQQIEVPERWS